MIRVEDPLTIIRDYVLSRGYQFAYGDDQFKNMFNDRITTIVGLSPINTSAIVSDTSGMITDFNYTTDIFVAQLGEIHETYDDKYYIRLKELKEELIYMLQELGCNKISFTSIVFNEFINTYDNNIDGISASLIFNLD